ncbi:hypothetical protein D6T65_05040 [Arthrobacter frigidicola]|nr:hypothetical protein D6T65_05040 [Arthrobacter frigidicola]
MTYPDLKRRLVKAYRTHSADGNPNHDGDPRCEDKLGAKLGSYTDRGFYLLMLEIREDTPELHPEARRDLAEYAIYLRNTHLDAMLHEQELAVANLSAGEYVVKAQVQTAA